MTKVTTHDWRANWRAALAKSPLTSVLERHVAGAAADGGQPVLYAIVAKSQLVATE